MSLIFPMTTTEANDNALMMQLQLNRKFKTTPEITVFELTSPSGSELPRFEAGAHVVVLTPSGATRRYSLCNSPEERHRYVLAIYRDAHGLGGSATMVDGLHEGNLVGVARPENFFPVVADTQQALLIAGGIGITPILAMVHSLKARGCPIHLLYCTKELSSTAFLQELKEMADAGDIALTLHHSHGKVEQRLDLTPFLAQPMNGRHIYCCGPRSLMQMVRDLTQHWPKAQLHFEDFGTCQSAPVSLVQDHSFTVCLSRQGKRVVVAAGESILSALRAQGVSVPSSCESGTCGVCRTGLLEGLGDHRDHILDEDEHHRAIMICVSRARSPELVLDL